MSVANRPRRRRRPLRIAFGVAGVAATVSLLVPLLGVAQDVDEIRPSPPSIGADVPVTYFAPPASTDEPHLIGPLQLLRTGPVDLDEGTITLPLYEGRVQRGDAPQAQGEPGTAKCKKAKAKVKKAKRNARQSGTKSAERKLKKAKKRLRKCKGKSAGRDASTAPRNASTPSSDEPRTVSSSALTRVRRHGRVAQTAGSSGGSRLWYVITDTSDKEEADALGLLHSAKLKYTSVAQRTAELDANRALVFDRGTVDFSPERRVEPGTGADAFPPRVAEPGSRGSRNYSPLVRVPDLGNTVYNAPIVSGDVPPERLNEFCDGDVDHSIVHDNVVAICPRDQTVTLRATTGFSFARPILYLSTDANDEVTATLEGVTYAPGLDVPVGGDDSAFSAIERIFIATNGPTGVGNPQRQGLNSAVRGEGSPLNVFGGIPTVANDYSPLWDANIYSWTREAIERGFRSRNFEEFRILGLAAQGHITGPNGAEFGSSGVIINCPPIFRFL